MRMVEFRMVLGGIGGERPDWVEPQLSTNEGRMARYGEWLGRKLADKAWLERVGDGGVVAEFLNRLIKLQQAVK